MIKIKGVLNKLIFIMFLIAITILTFSKNESNAYYIGDRYTLSVTKGYNKYKFNGIITSSNYNMYEVKEKSQKVEVKGRKFLFWSNIGTYYVPAGQKRPTASISCGYSGVSVYLNNTTIVKASYTGLLSVKSSNSNVASVSVSTTQGGQATITIKGKKKGNATITLTSELNEKTVTKTVKVTVLDIPPTKTDKGKKTSNNNNNGNGTSYIIQQTKTTSPGTVKSPPKDKTQPTCKITPSITKSNTNSSSITYTIKFSENVTGFTKGDVTLSGGGSIKRFSGSGSTYKVEVSQTANKNYTQKISVAAGKCKDAAGNKNKASNTVSKNIDTLKPVIKNVNVTDNSKNQKLTKSDEVYVEFDVYDAKYDKSKTAFNKDAVTLKVGGKNYTSATKTIEKVSETTTGAKYRVTLSNLQGSGKLDIELKAGQFFDTAGNKNDKYVYSKAVSTSEQIIVDNNKVTISSVTLSNSSGNKYDKNIYVKNGGTIQLDMKFSKALTVVPTVSIGGKTISATKTNDTTYVAKFTIPSNEATLKEGTIAFSISGYKSDNGLAGSTITKTTDSSTVIYDRTAPTIEKINYNEEAGVAKNTEWRKKQCITISAKDNIQEQKDLSFKYAWIKEGETSTDNVVDGVNGKTITKSDGTGKYILYGIFTDRAGNAKMVLTNPFYLDNSVTKPGTIIAHKNSEDGEEYKFNSKGENIYEGPYCSDNVYIHKKDGEDEESGHKSTTYCVYKIVDGQEIAVGLNSLEDTIIENTGEYKIVVQTTDNLENTGTTTYLIHKGIGNITFTPDGNSKVEGTGHTTVKLTDNTTSYTKIYYAWAEEGKEPEKYTKTINVTNALEGVNIDYPQENGKWNLYIKTIDQNGNTNIVKSNAFNLAAKITNPGKLIFKFNNQEGEEYIPQISGNEEKTYSKENIYIKIAEQGKDDFGGDLETTYQITDGETTVIGSKTTESTVLKNEGTYHVLATSTSTLGATKTVDYIVRIDKTSPTVIFTGTEDYQTTGAIGVTINDDGICSSGLKEDTMKYYWTRSPKQPNKTDFEGNQNNEYIGKINNTTSNIKIPNNVSGIWYLWIYAEDNAGNIAIKSNVKIEDSGNVSYVDNEAPTAGSLEIKINNQEGKEYSITEKEEDETTILEGEFTNENLYIKLLKGYDADSGVKTNTYSIIRLNDNTSFGNSITSDITLTEHGKYEITVTTVDNNNNSSTRKYIVNIDTKGPDVTFSNTENGENGSQESVKSIKVRPTVTDESGIAEDKLRYSWVKFESLEEFEDLKQKENSLEILKEKMGENSKTFRNGEEIPSPENINGIYSLFIYAEDTLGNASINYSEYYTFNLRNEENQNIYVLSGEYIKRVLPETTVENFKEKVKHIIVGSEYTVFDKNGQELSDEDYVTTASTIKVNDNTYTIIVIGDLNGDGKMSGIDIVRMRFSRVGKFELLGAYEKAADINNDGVVNGIDLVRMRLINSGLANYTE